jgi:Zn-dependent peptidase ImmA (M78 family)
MGALVYSETKPRQWGIAYHKNQSPGRKAFTLGHEFGHYILHRDLIEGDEQYDGGVYCDEESILQRDGKGIEKEADEFAATLLMPFHDFRRQLPANSSDSALLPTIRRVPDRCDPTLAGIHRDAGHDGRVK